MKLSIGIDLGGTNVKAVAIKPDGYVMNTVTVPTPPRVTANDLITLLECLVSEVIKKTKKRKNDFSGVGIGLAGLVDSEKGVLHFLTNIKCPKEILLRKRLQEKLKIPVCIDNDVNAICLGQLMFGKGAGLRNFLCITLGTGVGGALVFDGKLYRGAAYLAGEIGHMKLKEKGRRCNCGLSGCLEAYIGNKRILADVKKRLKSGAKSTLRSQYKKGVFRLEDITYAAHKGDRFSLKVWEEVAQNLGTVLASVINLLDIEAIIIGGGVSNAGKYLFLPLKKVLKDNTMFSNKRDIKIIKAGLDVYAGAIGAASLVWETK